MVQRRIDEVIKLGSPPTEIYPIDHSRHLFIDQKDDKIDESLQYKPSFAGLTANQVNMIFGKLYDAMMFFGYIKGEKVVDEDKLKENEKYVYFEPSDIVKKLRSKYVSILRNPVDDKEPLHWCHFQTCNADTLRRNSKYSAEYRAQKILQCKALKGAFIRPVYSGELKIE